MRKIKGKEVMPDANSHIAASSVVKEKWQMVWVFWVNANSHRLHGLREANLVAAVETLDHVFLTGNLEMAFPLPVRDAVILFYAKSTKKIWYFGREKNFDLVVSMPGL